MPEINWERLGRDLGNEAMGALKGALEGAQGDIKQYGSEIGKDLVRAVREDRPALGAEVREQLKTLAEIQRVRLNNATWDFVEEKLMQIVKVARVALLSAGAL